MTKVDWFSVGARLLGLWLLVQAVGDLIALIPQLLAGMSNQHVSGVALIIFYTVFSFGLRTIVGAGLLLLGDRLARRLYPTAAG
jgi:hypothetical protein